MKRLLIAFALCALACGCVSHPKSNLKTTALTTEYFEDAFIDTPTPRFSWINEGLVNGAAQTSYHIEMAVRPDFKTLLWDSGIVISKESVLVPYAGPELKSGTDYYWRVQVRDENGDAAPWSEVCHFHTGMFKDVHWSAAWIGAPWQGEQSYDYDRSEDVQPAPMLRKEFEISKPVKSVRFYGTGLGYFELYVNGKRVGNEYLVPNQTNYGYREKLEERLIPVPDPFNGYSVAYVSYDLMDYIEEGQNAVGAILGNGFYDLVFRRFVMGYGVPKFYGQIIIKYWDGSRDVIASDTTWKIARSAITFDQMYIGERYDARLEHDGWSKPGYDDSAWDSAVEKLAPEGKLVAQKGPSDRVTATYKPVSIEKIDSTGVFRVSFPEEISGWVALKNLKLAEGQNVTVGYINESLPQHTVYTAKGSGREDYHPRFEWYVFSQVDIAGLEDLQPSQIEAQAVNSDVKQTTSFETSNELINKIDKIWRRSMLDNMHGSVPTDCPHRERIGYTGDGQAVGITNMTAMGTDAFYNKWIHDILEAQKPDGYVANSAPWQPEAGGGIPWGASINIIPTDFFWEFGDERLYRECYVPMQEQTRWMTSWVDPATGVMESRSGHYFKDLGEWVPAFGLPSNALVHTWFLWACADCVVKAAEYFGDQPVIDEFTALRDRTAEAFHTAFYNPETGSYGKDGSNVFALAMGVPAEREQKVVDALVANIAEHDNHLHTGFVGFRYLAEVLVKYGHADLAYEIFNKRDYPSFGWWIEQGATVTWEQWDGTFSHNHPFMGGGILWFYRDLAGLEPTSPGYRTFEIRPTVVDGLSWVKFHKDCPYGRINIEWKVVSGAFTLKCTVPAGTTATVYIPDGDSVREEILPSGSYTLKGSVK
ncbi:MAG: alpha-L-rhamnosidase N-terminal domain-containing protein [Bacteroidales bacterium]|nr:alpha-L-rhamnosidase N-terminal domain-containing protein [Bacteroidales bacterium]